MPKGFQISLMEALQSFHDAHVGNKHDEKLLSLSAEEDVHVYAKEHIAEELDIDVE